MKPRTVFLLLGGLALLPYPGVFLAGVMSLAGTTSGQESILLIVVARSFLLGSMAYPLVYFPCLSATLRLGKEGQERGALKASALPLVFLAGLCLLLLVWRLLGT